MAEEGLSIELPPAQSAPRPRMLRRSLRRGRGLGLRELYQPLDQMQVCLCRVPDGLSGEEPPVGAEGGSHRDLNPPRLWERDGPQRYHLDSPCKRDIQWSCVRLALGRPLLRRQAASGGFGAAQGLSLLIQRKEGSRHGTRVAYLKTKDHLRSHYRAL